MNYSDGGRECTCPICQSVPKTSNDRERIIAQKLIAQFGKNGISPEEEIAHISKHISPGFLSSAICHAQEIYQILSKIFVIEDQFDDIPDDEKDDIDTTKIIHDSAQILLQIHENKKDSDLQCKKETWRTGATQLKL
jgi:hypothetical protein